MIFLQSFSNMENERFIAFIIYKTATNWKCLKYLPSAFLIKTEMMPFCTVRRRLVFNRRRHMRRQRLPPYNGIHNSYIYTLLTSIYSNKVHAIEWTVNLRRISLYFLCLPSRFETPTWPFQEEVFRKWFSLMFLLKQFI